MGLFDFIFGKTKKEEVLININVNVPSNKTIEELMHTNYSTDNNIKLPNNLSHKHDKEQLKKKHINNKSNLKDLLKQNCGNKFDFVALDFETSNSKHSICSAGIVVVKDGIIIKEKEWLIRPSSKYFESRNIEVHGINYETVKNSPMFPEVWEDLKYYIEDETIVGHNVLGTEIMCLKKAFEEYKIQPAPILNNYLCTLSLSRILLPGLENHKLSTIVEHLKLKEFNHHNALEDARACAHVLMELKTIIDSSSIIEKHETLNTEKKKSYFQGIQEKADESLIKFEKIVNLELDNKNIVITGVFDSYEREHLFHLLESKGANIKTGVNSKTDYLIVGHEPGPSKIKKASSLNIRMINESDLLDFL